MLRLLVFGVLVAGCVPAGAHQQKIARLEGRIDALESLYGKRIESEVRLRGRVEALRIWVEVLKSRLGSRNGPTSAAVPAAPSNPYSAEVDELVTIYKETGLLLSRLRGHVPESAWDPLVRSYFDVSISSGLLNEGLRRDYMRRLRRLHQQASDLARGAPAGAAP